jgi:hypothetical protein
MQKPTISMKFLISFLLLFSTGFYAVDCLALGERLSPTAFEESFTHKNKAIKFRKGVLVLGTSRTQVFQAFGLPHGSDVMPGGAVEDVYIFTPDGYKYVMPSPRARNVAMGVITMGTSVAVHQSLLAYQRSKLAIYRVYYNPQQKLIRATKETASALQNPAKPL